MVIMTQKIKRFLTTNNNEAISLLTVYGKSCNPLSGVLETCLVKSA
jgi:hypothetical protein